MPLCIRPQERVTRQVAVSSPALTLVPVGVIRTPFTERVSAPRQSVLARDVPGALLLDPKGGRGKGGFEHALADLGEWEYLWVLYWFHGNRGWRSKVLPPRGDKRKGVFATRSPHRPNPIGLSVVRLERVEGLTVHVRGVDMLDGSPLLDIKPYLAYADALPGAGGGWLESERGKLDPKSSFEIVWSALASEQAAWLSQQGLDLVSPVVDTLRLGPAPHPYRRIRKDGDAMSLAVKEWRVRFRVDGSTIRVLSVQSGYRMSQLEGDLDGALALHRGFVAKFR
jgi:tRNA-Thr(GGU) m(6)t(6)A37 methyltransferase TsaA